jgi:ABC-2 type transport system permease protein
LQACVYVSLVRHAGRPDLASYAVLAPAVIAVLGLAIGQAGEIISTDRWFGTLDGLLATPARLPVVLSGRVAAVTAVSLAAIVESWLAAGLVFGAWVTIAHPLVFSAAVLATSVAMAAAAIAMSSIFVLSRSVRTFQNSLSYPLLLLGGAFVPADLLPTWLQPLSRLVFLSWATDLLRDSLAPAPVTGALFRLFMVVLLGAAMYALGLWMFHVIVRRIQATGTVSLA